MYVKQVVLFILFYLSCCFSSRIWRHKSSCEKARSGFTCLPKIGDKRTVIIECPVKTRAYHIYINEFSGPVTLENLIIRNCKSLTVLFRCTKYAWERKNLKYLEISNIEKLKIQNVRLHQSLLPPTVVFENITIIENIYGHTFTQINKKLNVVGCVLPNYNFHSIHFRNVSINNVQASAFYMPYNFGNVTFTNVRIKTLDTSAIVVNHDRNGLFLVEDSTIGDVKPSAIQVVAQKVVFSKNKFGEILPSGFKVATNTFNFVNNTVDKHLHREGLAVDSEHVLMSFNRFGYLKSGALSKMEYSKNRLGYYKFFGNVINSLEEDGLQPKLYSYENVSAQVTFQGNIFSCECSQSGALLSKIGSKTTHDMTDAFYQNLFDEQSENRCSSTCNLPLYFAKEKIVEGTCSNDISVTDLCASYQKQKFEMKSTIFEVSTTFDVTTSAPTKFFPRISVSTPTKNSVFLQGSTDKVTSEQEMKNTTYMLPTTRETSTNMSSPEYTTSTIYSSEIASSENPNITTKNDLFTLDDKTEALHTKYTSSYRYTTHSSFGRTAEETSSSTLTSIDEDTSSATFPNRRTNNDLSTEDEMTAITDIPTSEVSSFTFQRSTSYRVPSFLTNNQRLKMGTTRYRFPTLAYNLTTAAFLVTRVPTTQYKPSVFTEKVHTSTFERGGYTRTVQENKISTPILKEGSVLSDREHIVAGRNSKGKETVENCSKINFLSYPLLFLLFSYFTIFL